MENDIRSHRILYAILCDTKSLSKRVIARKDDYISIFAMKRTREHFERIFRSKFDQTTVELLSHCPENIIELFYRFHDHCEQLKWYLIYTEDMPNAIDEGITRDIHLIETVYAELENQIENILYSRSDSLPPVPQNDVEADSETIDEIVLDEEFELED